MTRQGDPEIHAAVENAIRELTARLRGTTTMRGPDYFARQFILHLLKQNWRPPLRPPPTQHHTPADPEATTRRGAALARAALQKDPEWPTP